MSEAKIQIDLMQQLNANSVSIKEANTRFCMAAAGLPNDVVEGFLELLELYGDNCAAPIEMKIGKIDKMNS